MTDQILPSTYAVSKQKSWLYRQLEREPVNTTHKVKVSKTGSNHKVIVSSLNSQSTTLIVNK